MGALVQLLLHTIVLLALIGAYVALSLTGHDGNAILGVLVGYLGGAGVQTTITRAEEKQGG